MAKKVLVTPLRLQVGEYGRAEAGVPIRVRATLAERLVASGLWVEGESDRARAEASRSKGRGKAAEGGSDAT